MPVRAILRVPGRNTSAGIVTRLSSFNTGTVRLVLLSLWVKIAEISLLSQYSSSVFMRIYMDWIWYATKCVNPVGTSTFRCTTNSATRSASITTLVLSIFSCCSSAYAFSSLFLCHSRALSSIAPVSGVSHCGKYILGSRKTSTPWTQAHSLSYIVIQRYLVYRLGTSGFLR